METSKFTTQRDNTQLETIDIAVKPQSINRSEFMKLPLEERRRILAEQAEQMLLHYQQDKEWQELETGACLTTSSPTPRQGDITK